MSGLVKSHCPLRTDKVPTGWELVALGQFVDEIQTGFASGKHNSDGVGVPHLRPMNISPRGQIDLSDGRFVTGDKPLRLRRGDVLFNNTNSPAWVGKTALIDTNDELAFSNHMTRLRMQSKIDPAFVAKQLHFLCSCGYFLQQCKKHVNQASINRSFLSESTPFLLPPEAEQRRIVSKIESLQERSSRARVALSEVGPLLEQFRQSVLRAAFSGRLTADWRAARRMGPLSRPNEAPSKGKANCSGQWSQATEEAPYEPTTELLSRIRTERRNRWEQSELAKYEANGKQPPKNWQDNFKEPEPVDESELPELPVGWAWATVEELASDEPRAIQSGPFGSNLLHSEFQDTGILAIGIDNVHTRGFSMGEQHRISPQKYEELKKYTARPLDVLITVMATVGRCCVVPADLEMAIITKHVYRITLEQRLINPQLLVFAFQGASAVLNKIVKAMRGQTRPGINGGILKTLPIPVPPLAEQHEILDVVRRTLDQVVGVGEEVAESESALTQLDQSILAKAFRGELVAQDPRDEPASELLARIRQEREKKGAGGRVQGSGKRPRRGAKSKQA